MQTEPLQKPLQQALASVHMAPSGEHSVSPAHTPVEGSQNPVQQSPSPMHCSPFSRHGPHGSHTPSLQNVEQQPLPLPHASPSFMHAHVPLWQTAEQQSEPVAQASPSDAQEPVVIGVQVPAWQEAPQQSPSTAQALPSAMQTGPTPELCAEPPLPLPGAESTITLPQAPTATAKAPKVRARVIEEAWRADHGIVRPPEVEDGAARLCAGKVACRTSIFARKPAGVQPSTAARVPRTSARAPSSPARPRSGTASPR